MSAKPRLHAAPATVVSLAVILALAGGWPRSPEQPFDGEVARFTDPRRAEAANQPQCGDTITADTTLHQDLVNCPNNGIIIGADNITLDLNGHTIDGDGTPFAGCAQDEFCDVGVVRRRSRRGHREARLGARVRRWHSSSAPPVTSASWASRPRGTSSSASFSFAAIVVWSETAPETGRRAVVLTRWGCSSSNRITIGSSTAPSGATSPLGVAPAAESPPVESTNTVIRGNLMSRNGEAGIIMESSDGFRISAQPLGAKP